MKKRLIAGLGPAGTATTLVNLVMGGLPDVFAMGDTNSIKNYRGVEGGVLHGTFCSECGPAKECPVFTPEVIRQCLVHENQTYRIIGRAAGRPVIYTQDSPGAIYDKKGIPDVVLVLHRDIRAWCAAWALWIVGGKRFTVEIDKALPIPGLGHYEAAVARWISFYRVAFDWLDTHQVQWWSLNTDELRKLPEDTLRSICKALGLKYSSQALRWWENEHHKLGGRYAVKRGKQSRLGHAITYDEAWRKYTTVEQLEYVDGEASRYAGILSALQRKDVGAAQ